LTTGSSNVIWDDTIKKFVIKSLGASDVVGTVTAILECSILGNDQVQAVST